MRLCIQVTDITEEPSKAFSIDDENKVNRNVVLKSKSASKQRSRQKANVTLVEKEI